MVTHPHRDEPQTLERVRSFIDRQLSNSSNDLRNFSIQDALETSMTAPGDRSLTGFMVEPRMVTKYVRDSGEYERTDIRAGNGDHVHYWAVVAIGGDLCGRCIFRLEREANRVSNRLNKQLKKMIDEDWIIADEAASIREQETMAELAEMQARYE